MDYQKKVGYLKGLSVGLDIGNTSKEGHILLSIIDVLEELSNCLSVLEDKCSSLESSMEDVEEDVGELSEAFEDLEDGIDNMAEALGDMLRGTADGDNIRPFIKPSNEDEDEDDSEIEFELGCPACGEKIIVTEDMLDEGGTICPACKESLEFDFDGPKNGPCGCGHEHHHKKDFDE